MIHIISCGTTPHPLTCTSPFIFFSIIFSLYNNDGLRATPLHPRNTSPPNISSYIHGQLREWRQWSDEFGVSMGVKKGKIRQICALKERERVRDGVKPVLSEMGINCGAYYTLCVCVCVQTSGKSLPL